MAEISAIPTSNGGCEWEESTENRVTEATRDKEHICKRSMSACPSELKDEGEGNSQEKTTMLVEDVVQTKAEKPKQNDRDSSSLLSSSPKGSFDAEGRTTLRRETDMSLCDAPASSGHRDSILRLFQSRIVHVSDHFFRENKISSSQSHSSFDFDDFANELEAWLVIIRAKNYGNKNVFSPVSNPTSIAATTSFDSAVASPSANGQSSI